MSRGTATEASSGKQGALVAIVAVLIGALLGGIGGFAAGLLAFPRLFPAVPVSGVLEEREPGPLRSTGRFRSPDPEDVRHRGGGGVSVYDGVLELGEDFEIRPGPKYHVYLVPIRQMDPSRSLEASQFVDLGPLKAFKGQQRYPIPFGVRVEDYGTVAIWCERQSALISSAELESQQSTEPESGIPTPTTGG